jgi:HK97 family phage prohead protease
MTTIVGLAVPFHEVIRGKDGRLWRFQPGAFVGAIARQPVNLIINHADTSPVIASMGDPDRRLHLWENAAGLLFRYTPAGAIGETVLQHATRGAYIGASIGFRPSTSTSFEVNRIVSFTAVDLVEISLVPRGTVPAFDKTWVRVVTQTARGRCEWAA